MTQNGGCGQSKRTGGTLLAHRSNMAVFKSTVLAMTLLAAPVGVSAQATSPTAPAGQQAPALPDEPRRSTGKKLLDFVGDLEWRGIRPTVGTITSGGGPAAGLEFKTSRVGAVPMGVDIEGLISVRNYQQLAIRVGALMDRRSSVRLDPSDGSITSVVRLPNAVSPGRALYVEQRFRRLPALSLYGAAPADEATRTDFGQKVSSTELVFQWQGSRAFGVSARVGHLSSDPFTGRNNSLQNTESIFGHVVGPALDAEARYLVAGLGAALDGRDDRRRPTMGGVLNVAAWRYQSRSDAFASFTRLWLDARAYRMLLSRRHVLAARVLGSHTISSDTGDLPFQLAHHLGGSRVMRSFPSYRFRGRTLVTGTIESRWRVWRMHELVLFVDAGHVDRPTVPLGSTRVYTSTGLGARVWLSERIVLRGDVSTGRDGIRWVGTLGTPF